MIAMTHRAYLKNMVHGCRQFRKDGDYWLHQYGYMNAEREQTEKVGAHLAKKYPNSIVKVFKVRCHSRSWQYVVYWIHDYQMVIQDKERTW